MKSKHVFALIIVLVLCFLAGPLFAGGQQQEAPAEVSEGAVVEGVGPYIARTETSGEVVFSNGWTGTRIPLMDNQIEQFDAFYPNITIRSEVVTPADLERVNTTAIASGAPPDVMMMRSDLIPFLADNGAIRPLDDLIERDNMDVDDIFYAGELGAVRYNGQTWGLPMVVGGSRHYIYYNLDLVEQAGLDPENLPKTWQDLEEWARVIRREIPGSYILEPNRTCGSHPPLLVWMTTNNARYINEDMTEILLDSPEVLETLEWLVDFVEVQTDAYENMTMTEAPRMDCIQTPVQWTPGTYVAVTHGAAWFPQLRATAPDMRWAATLLPYNADNPDAEYGAPSYAGWTYMIPASAENVEAGWEWLKFATAGEGNREFLVRSQLRASPARIYNDDPTVAETNPIWELILDDLAVAKSVPVTPVHAEIREIMYTMGENALFGRMTPEEAVRWGDEEAQKVLDEWNARR